jgi:hypothetical protein
MMYFRIHKLDENEMHLSVEKIRYKETGYNYYLIEKETNPVFKDTYYFGCFIIFKSDENATKGKLVHVGSKNLFQTFMACLLSGNSWDNEATIEKLVKEIIEMRGEHTFSEW